MKKRTHAPRQQPRAKRQTDLKASMQKALAIVQRAVGSEMQVTIIARHPTNRDAEIWLGRDDPDQLMGMLLRRRAQYDASRKSGAIVVAPEENHVDAGSE
jgi:hypothetical protein